MNVVIGVVVLEFSAAHDGEKRSRKREKKGDLGGLYSF